LSRYDILTNHANAQSAGENRFWYIEQVFYGGNGETNARSQFARSYNNVHSPDMKVRHYHPSEGWSAWSPSIQQLFTSVSNGKSQVANAITQKGVPTSADAEFATMANNIGKIQTGKYYDGVFTIAPMNPKSPSGDYVTPLLDFEPVYGSTRYGGACIFNYAEIWSGMSAYAEDLHTLRMIKEQVGDKWQVRMRFYNGDTYPSNQSTVPYRLTN